MMQCDLFTLEGLQKRNNLVTLMQFHSWPPLPTPSNSSTELKTTKSDVTQESL